MARGEKRRSSSIDKERIRELVDRMCRDLSLSRSDIISELKGLEAMPLWKAVDLISEIWMTYS